VPQKKKIEKVPDSSRFVVRVGFICDEHLIGRWAYCDNITATNYEPFGIVSPAVDRVGGEGTIGREEYCL